MISFEDSFRRSFDPCWPPDGRWRSAQRHAVRKPRKDHAQHDDLLLSRTIAYLRKADKRATNINPGDADLTAAIELYENPSRFDGLRILVMGDCPRSQIAAYLETDVTTIEIVEGLFYDVRDHLDALDWLRTTVVAPEIQAGRIEYAGALKLALCGGARYALALVRGQTNLPPTAADSIFERHARLMVQIHALTHTPVSPQTVLESDKQFIDYLLAREKLDLQIKKFKHKCEADWRRWAREDEQRAAREAKQEMSEDSSTPAADGPEERFTGAVA